jgi:signal peptidase
VSAETTTDGTAAVRRGNRTLVGVFGLLVILALVAPFAVFAVPQVVGADEGFVVLSGSMEPYMSAGDVVIVESVRPRNLRVGDVITFERGGDVPTTHRVIERIQDENGLGLRTMGDANEDPDAGVVRPAEVIGRVAFVIPVIGFVITFANTTVGMVAFIVIPVALLVITEAWRLLDARRERDAVAAPIPAIRRMSDDSDDADGAVTAAPAPRAAANAASEPAYAVKTLDLGLTFVVLVALAAYSGWMLYNEIRVESAMVLTGSVMALLLVVATWVLALRAARSADTGGEQPDEGENDSDDPDDGVSATARPAPRRSVRRVNNRPGGAVRPDRDPVMEGSDD